MDTAGAGKGRWDWLPALMPGVARLMAQRRRELGAEHMALCWKRGVVEMQPGWFFAAEGALAVGVPWPADAQLVEWMHARVTPTQALLVIRPKEVGDGT